MFTFSIIITHIFLLLII